MSAALIGRFPPIAVKLKGVTAKTSVAGGTMDATFVASVFAESAFASPFVASGFVASATFAGGSGAV